ncbi:MAG: hypothetical protein QOE92_1613 [Chloroflexota bacterium]|jgi:NAD(P)-dependent dehydrogenase (short-subunit alcohol dehydrogenase family)|nr:hypothetical protein [Chloroflexota bacterium]
MTTARGLRVVVTGAGGGIGAAACEALRGAGASVVGIDLRPPTGDVIAGDVRDERSMRAAIDEASRRLGAIDVLVNNAGIGTVQDAGQMPDAAARATLEVNLIGAWVTTAAAMPHLLATRGHVVNVASGLALATVPFTAAYAASKRALTAYSDTLRFEYRGRVTVTTVNPGYIRTAIHSGPAAQGASLDGVVNEDSVAQAAAAIVRACVRRPRETSTSATTAAGLFMARHFPRIVDAFLRRRARGVAVGLRPVVEP